MNTILIKKYYAQASRWAFPCLVIILLLSLRECRNRGQEVALLNLNIDSAAMLATHFENERGQIIAENKQLLVKSSRELKSLTDSIFALKKEKGRAVKSVQEYARIIQQFKTGEKFAPFTPDSTPTAGHVPDPPDTNLIRVPRPFMYMDSTVIFGGRVTRLGVRLDSIRIENTVHYRTVINKTGFLKLGRSSTVQVLNTNPAITTLGVTSLIVPHTTNWWNRWGKPLAAAILAGVAVDHFKR